MFINNTLFFALLRYSHTPGVIPKLFAVHEMYSCVVTENKLYCHYLKEHFNLSFLHLALLHYMLEYFSQFNEMWPLHPILKYVSCSIFSSGTFTNAKYWCGFHLHPHHSLWDL